MLCTLTRADQEGEEKFKCFAFESKPRQLSQDGEVSTFQQLLKCGNKQGCRGVPVKNERSPNQPVGFADGKRRKAARIAEHGLH